MCHMHGDAFFPGGLELPHGFGHFRQSYRGVTARRDDFRVRVRRETERLAIRLRLDRECRGCNIDLGNEAIKFLSERRSADGRFRS